MTLAGHAFKINLILMYFLGTVRYISSTGCFVILLRN